MKKKTLAVLLAISCSLSMAACGASGGEDTEAISRADEAREELEKEFSEEAPEEEVEEKPEEVPDETGPEEEVKDEPEDDEKEIKKTTSMPSDLSDDLYDFQISIDGTVYQFPMWYSDFEALGWEYDGDDTEKLSSNQYSVAEIWTKDGFKIYTEFANLSMNSVSFSESMVAGIELNKYGLEGCDWEILLPGGIQYGVSNADDIKEAYGEPSRDFDSDLYYMMSYELDYYREVTLYVFKEEGVLLEVELENLVELEGADNSIDETVPELVEAYKAPKSLGDDFYAYTAQMEGVVYSLPCPVSVMLENGFTIDTAKSDSEVAAGGSGWVDLRYNNQTLHTMVKNYADYATTVENCFVVSMESSVNGPKFDLVFPGGIKVGDSEDAVKKATADFNCEVDTSDSGYTYYEVSDPDGSTLNRYTIVCKDGSVCTLDIQNSEEPEY